MLSVFNKNYNGRAIRIREDKYVCLTDMAIASGKLLGHWRELKGTTAYLEALSAGIGITIPVLLEVSDGNPTWGHPKLAIRFAQWCSPEFAVQVDFWIDELMTVGTVSIAPEPQFQRQLAPQRDILDYWEACQQMGIDRDPILLSLFSQRMAEQLGGTAIAATQQVIVTVRAHELGYSAKEIGSGSALGRFVKQQGCLPTGQTKHGKYDVNVYDLTEDLDTAICLYFS
jgi:KilA-N domain